MVEGRLISYCYKTREDNENIEFAKETEEYQLVFKELRKNSDFINDIKDETNNITSISEFSAGGEALEAWCEKNKKLLQNEKGNSALKKKVRDYCERRPAIMGAKIEKMGKAFTTRWKEKLDSIKVNVAQNDPDLQKDLQDTSNAVISLELSDQRTVYDALQRWCEGNLVRKVIEDNEDKIWNKMEKRCFD